MKFFGDMVFRKQRDRDRETQGQPALGAINQLQRPEDDGRAQGGMVPGPSEFGAINRLRSSGMRPEEQGPLERIPFGAPGAAFPGRGRMIGPGPEQDRIAELEEVAAGLFWMLDEGVLVRDVKRDAESNYPLRSMRLARKLAEFHEMSLPIQQVEAQAELPPDQPPGGGRAGGRPTLT